MDSFEFGRRFEFMLLDSIAAPVGETIAPGEQEGKLDAEPFARSIKAERCGKVHRRCNQRDGHDPRAGIVQEANQEVGDETTGEAGNRKSIEEVRIAREESEERGREHQSKQDPDRFGAG